MPESDQTPDVYADQFIVTVQVWGVNLTFAKGPPHPSPGQPPQAVPQAVVRMSLQHAKIVAMMLRMQMKNWERNNVEILIPHEVYAQLGVGPEDW